MTIDKQTFQNLFTALMEQFRWKFSTPAIAEYYQHLSPKLETESFEAAVKHIFINSEKFERFPSPNQILEIARSLAPVKTFQLPENLPKSAAEMSPEEREVVNQAIAAARAVIKEAAKNRTVSKSGLSSVGSHLAQALPVLPKSLEQQFAQMLQWWKSGDRVLAREGMDWLMNHASVSPVMDESGGVVDFELKQKQDSPN